MARIFIYGDNRYDDPGPDFTIDDVRKHLSQFFPELGQATFSEKKIDDDTVEVTFAKKVGTKGAVYRAVSPVNGTITLTVPDWPAPRLLAEKTPPAGERVLFRFENGDMLVASSDSYAADTRPPWLKKATHWWPLPPDPEAR